MSLLAALDYGGAVEGLECSGLVGLNQPWSTEFDAAKIAHHTHKHVSELKRADLPEYGAAGRAAWFAVVVAQETVVVWAKHICPAAMPCIVILVLIHLYCSFGVVFVIDRYGKGNEFAHFGLVYALRSLRYGFVAVAHSGCAENFYLYRFVWAKLLKYMIIERNGGAR